MMLLGGRFPLDPALGSVAALQTSLHLWELAALQTLVPGELGGRGGSQAVAMAGAQAARQPPRRLTL